jgi:hypothetical protein
LRHNAKEEMFGRDNGFKCPNLRWTVPGFQSMKGIIHVPCAKPALRLESRDAPLTGIPMPGDGSPTSGSVTSWSGPRFLQRGAVGSRRRRWMWPGCPGGARRVRALAKDQS